MDRLAFPSFQPARLQDHRRPLRGPQLGPHFGPHWFVCMSGRRVNAAFHPGPWEEAFDRPGGEPAVDDDQVRPSAARQPLQPVSTVRLSMDEMDQPDAGPPHHGANTVCGQEAWATTTSGRVLPNLSQLRTSPPDRPRPAEPNGPKVVNRHPGRDQLVPQPAAEAESELRLHARSHVPQPGHGRQERLDPAVRGSRRKGAEPSNGHSPNGSPARTMGRGTRRSGRTHQPSILENDKCALC